MLILGLDPGSQNTGFGLLHVTDMQPNSRAGLDVRRGREGIKYVEHGVLQSKGSDFNARLRSMGAQIQNLFLRVKPNVTVIEKVFLGKNVDSAFKLGHVRGLCVFNALNVESEVVEYAARSIKKGITGNGAAEKDQVQLLTFNLLGLSFADPRTSKSLDATDALAMAYFHARQMEVLRSLQASDRRTETKSSRTKKEMGI